MGKDEPDISELAEKAKSKREVVVPDIDVIAIQENIMFADDLTESLLVQMIHTMS